MTRSGGRFREMERKSVREMRVGQWKYRSIEKESQEGLLWRRAKKKPSPLQYAPLFSSAICAKTPFPPLFPALFPIHSSHQPVISRCMKRERIQWLAIRAEWDLCENVSVCALVCVRLLKVHVSELRTQHGFTPLYKRVLCVSTAPLFRCRQQFTIHFTF